MQIGISSHVSHHGVSFMVLYFSLDTFYELGVYKDYVIESATYGFLFTSCKTLENERVNKNPYKALSML